MATCCLRSPLLGITRLDAAVIGSVLAAVFPAVVVPGMLRLMQERRGTRQRIPELILAGASCDDLFVLVRFSSVTGMAQGRQLRTAVFPSMPASIVLGAAAGALARAPLGRRAGLPATLLILLAPQFRAVGMLLFLIATPPNAKKAPLDALCIEHTGSILLQKEPYCSFSATTRVQHAFARLHPSLF